MDFPANLGSGFSSCLGPTVKRWSYPGPCCYCLWHLGHCWILCVWVGRVFQSWPVMQDFSNTPSYPFQLGWQCPTIDYSNYSQLFYELDLFWKLRVKTTKRSKCSQPCDMGDLAFRVEITPSFFLVWICPKILYVDWLFPRIRIHKWMNT